MEPDEAEEAAARAARSRRGGHSRPGFNAVVAAPGSGIDRRPQHDRQLCSFAEQRPCRGTDRRLAESH